MFELGQHMQPLTASSQSCSAHHLYLRNVNQSRLALRDRNIAVKGS